MPESSAKVCDIEPAVWTIVRRAGDAIAAILWRRVDVPSFRRERGE